MNQLFFAQQLVVLCKHASSKRIIYQEALAPCRFGEKGGQCAYIGQKEVKFRKKMKMKTTCK